MRFNQLTSNYNSIIRKKLYKKGKVWIVASILSFAGVLMLGSEPVKAATVDDSQSTTQQSDALSGTDVTDQSNNEDTSTTVTKSLMVSSNLGEVNVSVTGQVGTTVNVPIPEKTGYTVTGNSTIAVEIGTDGSVSTKDSIVYTANNSDVNSTSVQSQTNISTQSDTTNDESTDSYIYTGDNVKQNDDGTYSASVNYQGQTYDVSGKAGDTVRRTDSSGNSVAINIETTKQQKYTDPAGSNTVNLTSSTALYDQYGRKDTQTLAGNEQKVIDAQMTDYKNNVFYHLVGDSDQWIKQDTGVKVSGNKTLDSEVVTTPVFIINDPTLNNGKYESVTEKYDADTGEVTGTVVVHSDYYDKDLTYSYSGKSGEIVKATLNDNDGSMITPNVSVGIQANNVVTPLDPYGSVSLDGPNTHVYDLYYGDGSKANVGFAGNTAWAVMGYKFINNVPYYQVSTDEWVKQGDGVTYNGDIKIVDNTTYTATPYVEPLIVADVTINSNLGKKTVKAISGFAGDDVTVNVPDVSGYTKDKDTVTAHINADGTITSSETVTYKKTDSGNTGGGNGGFGVQLDFIKKGQDVSTFVGKGNVTLYKLSGTEFTPVENRALAENSDWYSDQYVKVGGMTYFRVATNEWVRVSDVYRYKSLNTIININDQTARLLNDEGVLIANRALAPRTSWLVDRIGYLGSDDNPTAFYRVATNEFVNISDTIQ